LDFNNIGSWPGALKVIVAALLFAVLLFLGYQFHLKDLQAQLERTEAQEATLRKEFTDKSFKAANLDAYKEQLIEIEDRFGTLLKQLPSDTEVPGLLEDITQMGLNSGLEFESITLQPEVERQFYIELPIKIVVQGNYHDIATFVSSVAGLPRIVTLHDFDIKPVSEGNPDLRNRNIVAETYRDNESGGQQWACSDLSEAAHCCPGRRCCPVVVVTISVTGRPTWRRCGRAPPAISSHCRRLFPMRHSLTVPARCGALSSPRSGSI